MPRSAGRFRASRSTLHLFWLHYENKVFGVLLLVLAARSWCRFALLTRLMSLYMFQDVYAVPALSLVTMLSSAIYLTVSGAVLILLAPPVARYDSLVPNLMSVFAGFCVYGFSLLPQAGRSLLPVWMCLLLILCGNVLVLAAFLYLRSNFSVTPQVRSFVHTGPYRFMRHPMYAGNLLLLAGLALLIGTPLALCACFVTSCLQVARAVSEERLLTQWIPEYRRYRRTVGAFFPMIRKYRLGILLPLVAVATLFQSSAMAQEPPASSPLRSPETLGDQCSSLYGVAMSGIWATDAQSTVFRAIEPEEEKWKKVSACRSLFDLADTCTAYGADLMGDDSIAADKIISTLETIDHAKGCRVVIGLDNLCGFLEDLSRKKAKVPSAWQGLLPQCIDSRLRSSTGNFFRAAL